MYASSHAVYYFKNYTFCQFSLYNHEKTTTNNRQVNKEGWIRDYFMPMGIIQPAARGEPHAAPHAQNIAKSDKNPPKMAIFTVFRSKMAHFHEIFSFFR
ncbi:MAG: hypothetical protein EOM20_18100 [Spartobacteria bacterium]|nr:hypothetical protein [Spartobacteria bacterium]